MPTPTYTALATIALSSAASSVTFSSIPATYRDLVIVVSALGSTNLEGRIRFNGNTGANYGYQRLSGNGTSASATSASAETFGYLSAVADATTTEALDMQINIMDYSATDKHKTIINRANAVGLGTEAFVNRFASTSAIDSVTILTSTGNWAAGSTFALYGVIA